MEMHGLAALLLIMWAAAIVVPAVPILWFQAWFIHRDARKAVKHTADVRAKLWKLADEAHERLHDAMGRAAWVLLCFIGSMLLYRVAPLLLVPPSIICPSLALYVFGRSVQGDSGNREALDLSQGITVVAETVPVPRETQSVPEPEPVTGTEPAIETPAPSAM